jgi:Asp-tRNA(Asn)/Glu-tRNA(Gln) amidotransferase A subunit family amidase
MTSDPSGYTLTLTEAVEAIAEGRSTSAGLAAAELARVRATDAAVEAWATLDPDYVQREAAARDDAGTHGALSGIGIGVKDIIATADLPTEMGSPIFAGNRPASDAVCVARLKAAGGFVFGKTVTTPFAFLDPGKTRNPWDPAYSPGGSSSGSAAAVAVGHVTAAIGTQNNGSIIRPAAYCGVVGFKPTRNAIPSGGVYPFSETFDTVGTFTRTVEDAARLAATLADPGRIGAMLAPLARTPRFAYIGGFPWIVQDCDADDVVEAAVTQLRTRAEVVPVDIPPAWREARDIHRTIMLFEAARNLGELQFRERPRMSPAVNAALDEGRTIRAGVYEAARAQREKAIAFFTQWLEGFDAILSPAAPGPAPRGLATTGDPSCCTLWSLLGFPAITVPAGLAQHMPVGLQLAAPLDCDDRLLAVAAWCGARLTFRGLV